MSSILYKKQHKDKEKPIYDPNEFKEMLEREEPRLQGFFEELVASTNPHKKNSITNQQNKKKLVEALKEYGIKGAEGLLKQPLIAGFTEVLLDNGIYLDLMSSLQFWFLFF